MGTPAVRRRWCLACLCACLGVILGWSGRGALDSAALERRTPTSFCASSGAPIRPTSGRLRPRSPQLLVSSGPKLVGVGPLVDHGVAASTRFGRFGLGIGQHSSVWANFGDIWQRLALPRPDSGRTRPNLRRCMVALSTIFGASVRRTVTNFVRSRPTLARIRRTRCDFDYAAHILALLFTTLMYEQGRQEESGTRIRACRRTLLSASQILC